MTTLEDLKKLSFDELTCLVQANCGSLSRSALYTLVGVLVEASRKDVTDVHPLLVDAFNQPYNEEHRPAVVKARECLNKLLE